MERAITMNRNWSNQEIVRVSEWRHQYWIAANYVRHIDAQHHALDRELENIETAFKHDQTTTVAKLEISGNVLVLKRYNARNQWHKFKRAFRGSRARRCWSMSYHFQRAGLNVSEPILMYEKRFGPVRSHAYFANRLLMGEELITALPRMADSEQQKVQAAVRASFSTMRTHKLSHGDMKASNLLWVDGELYFIDLDAARKHRSLWSWYTSHAKDKKRFLKNWQSQPNLLALFEEI
ncbi:MAG: tRNA A-37 threonylcarbamoyl transferase component Bud32 [Arenicella sp.]|jgi:tRNA A-37 threonylcarbamoyl transferase component Bud32